MVRAAGNREVGSTPWLTIAIQICYKKIYLNLDKLSQSKLLSFSNAKSKHNVPTGGEFFSLVLQVPKFKITKKKTSKQPITAAVPVTKKDRD